MEFLAEIAETKQRKAYSGLDQSYSITLKTINPLILDLGKLPALTLFKVTVDIVERVVDHGEDKIIELKREKLKLPKRKELVISK